LKYNEISDDEVALLLKATDEFARSIKDIGDETPI